MILLKNCSKLLWLLKIWSSCEFVIWRNKKKRQLQFIRLLFDFIGCSQILAKSYERNTLVRSWLIPVNLRVLTCSLIFYLFIFNKMGGLCIIYHALLFVWTTTTKEVIHQKSGEGNIWKSTQWNQYWIAFEKLLKNRREVLMQISLLPSVLPDSFM